MNFWPAVFAMFKKDMVFEWRHKYAISGILLYMLCIVFIIFITFNQMKGPVWVVLFWIVILFSAVSAVAKSFLQEPAARQLYYYTLAAPRAIMLAKIFYNICIMIFLAVVALLFYSITNGFPIVDSTSFMLVLLLGSIAFATVFSMISAIAAKASNSGTLMAILSFPMLIPVLLILIRVSLNALTANDLLVNASDLLYLLALNILILALALILFPYLWRD